MAHSDFRRPASQIEPELQYYLMWLTFSVQKYRADERVAQRTYPLIFGRVEHRAYTLLDSFRLSAREFDMDERVERVHVNRFLDGAWFDDPE